MTGELTLFSFCMKMKNSNRTNRLCEYDQILLNRPTRAEIDLLAIRSNFKEVERLVGKQVRIMAVVKGNAYGHGILEVARAVLSAGANCLGVAIVEEGIFLRRHGVTAPILVFTPPFDFQLDEHLKHDLEVSLCSIATAQALNSRANSAGKPAVVHLKVDTGMGRIGVAADEAAEFASRVSKLPGIQIKGIFTHFATSDEKDHPFIHTQLNRFRAVLSQLRRRGISYGIAHCANSGAILNLPDSRMDMVRAGLLLYGYSPSSSNSRGGSLQPAMALKSRVMFLKQVPGGTPLGYGRRYYSPRQTTIVSVPIGYADGLSRRLSNKAHALINGKYFPVVGTICMDQVMIDVGNGGEVQVGDSVVFIGTSGRERITAWDMARADETIPYEILCSVSSRVPRIYIDSRGSRES
jgi:alanine racemase